MLGVHRLYGWGRVWVASAHRLHSDIRRRLDGVRSRIVTAVREEGNDGARDTKHDGEDANEESVARGVGTRCERAGPCR